MSGWEICKLVLLGLVTLALVAWEGRDFEKPEIDAEVEGEKDSH